MRFATRHDARRIEQTIALKLSNLANKRTNTVLRDSLLVAILQSLINFNAVFEKEHGVFFLAAQMVVIVKNKISSDFLSENSPLKYQRYIQMAKIFLQRHKILNNIEVIDGEDTGCRMLGLSHIDDGSSFTSRTKEGPPNVRVVGQYVWNLMGHNRFQNLFFDKSGKGLLRELYGMYKKKELTSIPSFSAFVHKPFP